MGRMPRIFPFKGTDRRPGPSPHVSPATATSFNLPCLKQFKYSPVNRRTCAPSFQSLLSSGVHPQHIRAFQSRSMGTRISLAPVTSSESASIAQDTGLNVLYSMLSSTTPVLTAVNPGFDSLPSSSYPTFGGETYSKPPFAMEDEFTAWLFNESSVPSSSVAYPSWRGVVPSYLDAAQLQTRTHELSLGGGISHRSMSVARTSDPGSPRTVMSDDKLQELLHLMATRFNKAACSTETTRKESFLEGDVNNDNHILSLRMTRTYIESYWYHFHPQLPILHRSAFVADHAPNLLLAITAIGVSTLDRIHGPEVIETVLRVGQFHRLASPMGGILDAEFQAPTKLCVYQACCS